MYSSFPCAKSCRMVVSLIRELLPFSLVSNCGSSKACLSNGVKWGLVMLTPAVTLCQLWDKAMGIVTASAASLNLVVLGCAEVDSLCSEDCGLLDPSGDTWGGSVADGAFASAGT